MNITHSVFMCMSVRGAFRYQRKLLNPTIKGVSKVYGSGQIVIKKKSYFQYFFLSFLQFSEPYGATWRSPLFYNSFFLSKTPVIPFTISKHDFLQSNATH